MVKQIVRDVFFFAYGLEFSGGSAAESATYVEILRTIEKKKTKLIR